MPDEMLEELLRRGDLSVVRWKKSGRCALMVDETKTTPETVTTFDADEWRWLLICAAPVALRTLELAERERRDREERAMADEKGQAAMRLDDEKAVTS